MLRKHMNLREHAETFKREKKKWLSDEEVILQEMTIILNELNLPVARRTLSKRELINNGGDLLNQCLANERKYYRVLTELYKNSISYSTGRKRSFLTKADEVFMSKALHMSCTKNMTNDILISAFKFIKRQAYTSLQNKINDMIDTDPQLNSKLNFAFDMMKYYKNVDKKSRSRCAKQSTNMTKKWKAKNGRRC